MEIWGLIRFESQPQVATDGNAQEVLKPQINFSALEVCT